MPHHRPLLWPQWQNRWGAVFALFVLVAPGEVGRSSPAVLPSLAHVCCMTGVQDGKVPGSAVSLKCLFLSVRTAQTRASRGSVLPVVGVHAGLRQLRSVVVPSPPASRTQVQGTR